MNTCVFCRIVSGELPSAKVYEDENFLAFLDIHPTSKGHTLVIPKKHVVSFLETEPALLEPLFTVTQKVSRALMAVLGSPAVNVEINNGKEAGQIILHTHVHIIPRFAKDGLKHWPQGYTYTENETTTLASQVTGKITPPDTK